MAVKFIDVLFATWLVQSISRILWKATESGSLFNLTYSESLISPTNPSNGSIFNSFSGTYQNVSLPIDYSGHHFALDIASSIFSLLWHHGAQMVAVWFILEALGYLWSSSDKLVIINASDGDGVGSTKDEKGDKHKSEPTGPNLADLLATKLDRIKQIYQTVDEKRSIQSACGAGEPIDAAIKVERLDDISLSSTSEIKLGPFGIPASSVSALISHILIGPKITIGLYRREQGGDGDEKEKEKSNGTEKEKAKRVLMANMSGKMGSQRWVVECRESLEGEFGGKERSIEDMITEMAHRIHASYACLQSEKPGQSISWRALWNFNEGLRAYRDSLLSNKKHKFYLNRAEKKFIDALKEENSFSLANYNLGVVYAELNQPDSAQECFQKAIDVNPDSWEAYYALGIVVYRRAKEMEQMHEILGVDKQPAEEKWKTDKKRIKDDYEKVIILCKRVLEIKSREEGILEKDFSVKAKAYDLMGNAQARLACIPPINKRDDSARVNTKECNVNLLNGANLHLQKAVRYSWMALIKESVLHETAEDETSIVSECTLDLANVYMKLSECEGAERRPKMKGVLMQAIYTNPKDVRLYYLLARVGVHENCLNFMRRVYEQIQLINPDCYRIKANLASIELGLDNKPASWLKECENSGFCDDEAYERIYHFLVRVIEEANNLYVFSWNNIPGTEEGRLIKFLTQILGIDLAESTRFEKDDLDETKRVHSNEHILLRKLNENEKIEVILEINGNKTAEFMPRMENGQLNIYYNFNKNDYLSREHSYKMKKTIADLTILSKRRKKETSELQRKKMGCWFKECCEPCPILFHLKRESAEDLINGSSFRDYLEKLLNRIEPYGQDKQSGPLSIIETKKANAFEIMDDLFALGICRLKFASVKIDDLKADDENDGRDKGIIELNKYLKISIECFHAVLQISNCKSYFEISSTHKFYKLECAHYMVESGKNILKLVEIGKSQEISNFESIKWAMELFKTAKEILNDIDPEEIKRNKINLRLAQTYLACGKLPNALKEAQIAKNLNPLDYEERKVLGEIFCKLEEYKYGLAELNVALSYKPDDSEILLCTGRAYFSAGKDCKRKGEERIWILKNAREKLEEALDIADRSEVRYRGKIRYWIGRTLLEMGKYEEAIPHLRILAEKDERDFLPALYLGYAYLKCSAHEECESRLYKLIKSLKSKNNAIIDKFYGQQYDEERHINEILARAYIYLAYSYAERDANPCDSWELASDAQLYIENLKERHGLEEERARDGVLPEKSDKSCTDSGYGFLSVSALDVSDQSLSVAKELAQSYSIDGKEIKIVFNRKDGMKKRKSKAHLAECAGTICYKMGKLDAAVDYLNASIALYPDAGAYLNLAKAYERMILCGVAEESDKDLIGRTIRDLCRHVEALDLRDEHKGDLNDFRKRWPDEEEVPGSSAGDSSKSGQKVGEDGTVEAKKPKNGN